MKCTITATTQRKNPCLICEEVRRHIHSSLECGIRSLAETGESVLRLATAALFNHVVVVLLPVFDGTDGERGTGLHDRATEQPTLISFVRHHVQSH